MTWLAGSVYTLCQVTGHGPDHVLWELPAATAAWLMVMHLHHHGTKLIDPARDTKADSILDALEATRKPSPRTP